MDLYDCWAFTADDVTLNIQCLENRVQVLEAQNKQLIDELQKLKRTYVDNSRGVEHQPQGMYSISGSI